MGCFIILTLRIELSICERLLRMSNVYKTCAYNKFEALPGELRRRGVGGGLNSLLPEKRNSQAPLNVSSPLSAP